jgi:3-oxoacyl-[acyl-carrier protein] reductase
MDTGLAGRVALVTGATRGIGFAIAEGLRAEGADVAVLARSKDGVDDAVARLGGEAHAHGIVADLTDPEQVDRAVQEAADWRGRLHVVVNNAGPPMQSGTITDTDDEPWAMTFATKAMGMVRVARAALPLLADDGTGRIVNVSGVTAKSVIPNAGITGITNAAVGAFTRYLAEEAAPRGIRVNAVCPGMTRTEGWLQRAATAAEQQGITAEQFFANMTERLGVSLGRWAEPREIADVVVFCASDRVAFMTGHVLVVDGGQTKLPG